MFKEVALSFTVSLCPLSVDSVIEPNITKDTATKSIKTDYTTTTYNFITTQDYSITDIINLLKEIESRKQKLHNRQSE